MKYLNYHCRVKYKGIKGLREVSTLEWLSEARKPTRELGSTAWLRFTQLNPVALSRGLRSTSSTP
jgi:hypothetical protein